MSFKKWSFWEKFFAIIGGLAGITALVDWFSDKVDIIIPTLHLVGKLLTHPVSFFWIPLTIIVLFLLLWIISWVSEKSKPTIKEGVLQLNDNCEARYSYFLESLQINYYDCHDGYELYCSIHDLKLHRFFDGLDCTECNGSKRIINNQQEIVSLIERDIRRENS